MRECREYLGDLRAGRLIPAEGGIASSGRKGQSFSAGTVDVPGRREDANSPPPNVLPTGKGILPLEARNSRGK